MRLNRVSLIRGTYLYYQALMFGTGMMGVYFYIILTATIPDVTLKSAFYLTGLILVASVYGLCRTKTRSGRTTLTAISGLFGGAHAFMDFVLFPDFVFGFFLFLWLFLGLLLAGAALFWLPETDHETTAE